MGTLIFLAACLAITIVIDTNQKRRNYFSQGK
jgi:hypothetical protein